MVGAPEIRTITVNWAHYDCGTCGIQFMVPVSFSNERHNDKGSWYCPNGHSWQWSESTTHRLERQLESARKSTAFAERRMQSEIRSHRSTKGHLTRQKRRAAAGVCPCCTRTFKQLSRHMKNKHPDYTAKTLDA